MIDVAKVAGVSRQTVSRVLNDSPHVSINVRQRVELAIKELGYHPNILARSLRQRRPLTIGVLTLAGTGYGTMQAVLGVESAARQAGYGVSLAAISTPTFSDIQSALENFSSQPVAGLILLTPDQRFITALVDTKVRIPMIMAGGAIEGALPSVDSHQRLGARIAVQHLIAQGHTRIGHLAGPASSGDSAERIAGWREALRGAGLDPSFLLRGDWTARSGYQASSKVVCDRSATAVFVANDQMALGLLRGIQESGLRIPEEMGIIGYGDQAEAAYFSPPLSTVRLDFKALGSLCVEALLAEETPCARPILAPEPVLKIRSTSVRLPARVNSID